MTIAKEIKAAEILINVYETLADAYAKKGDYNTALSYQKQLATEKDKFISAESTRQLNEMRVKYETVKKDNEITKLQNEKAISTLKLNEQNLLIQKRDYLLFVVFLWDYLPIFQ